MRCIIISIIVLLCIFYHGFSDSIEDVPKSNISFFTGVNYFIAQEEFYREGYDNDLLGLGIPFGLNFGWIYKIQEDLNLRTEFILNSKSYESENMSLSKFALNLLLCYNHKLEKFDFFAGIGPSANLILAFNDVQVTNEIGRNTGTLLMTFFNVDLGFSLTTGLNFQLSDWTMIDCGLNYSINNLNETLLNESTKNWYGNVGGLNIFCNIIFNFDGEAHENF